jgi:hypothetical protein
MQRDSTKEIGEITTSYKKSCIIKMHVTASAQKIASKLRHGPKKERKKKMMMMMMMMICRQHDPSGFVMATLFYN